MQRTDLSYLGMLSDSELIERANYYPNAELCIALASRLKEQEADSYRALRDEISDLQDNLSEAEQERDEATDDAEVAERRIKELEDEVRRLERIILS